MRKMKALEQANVANVLTLRRYRDRMNEIQEEVDDFEEEQRKINKALQRVIAGLIFVTAGLAVSLLKIQVRVKEIRNVMNEG